MLLAISGLARREARRGFNALRTHRRDTRAARSAYAHAAERLTAALSHWLRVARVLALAERAFSDNAQREAARRWRDWRQQTGRAGSLRLRCQYLLIRRWVAGARGGLYALSTEARAASRAQVGLAVVESVE